MLLIVNPSAGGGRAAKALPDVEAALRRWGADLVVERTRDIEHADELAVRAVEDDRVAVAFGGDGLLGRVAGAVAARDGLFAALPGGRGNDFLRSLGAPLDPIGGAVALATARERRLDLAVAGDRPYLGIASVGFDSDVQVIANRTKLIRGSQVYTYAALRAVVAWKPATFTFSVDGGEPRELVGWSVAAANSAYYGGGMRYAPGAELDDGALDVVLSARTSRRTFLAAFPKVFKGRHVEAPTVEVLRASRLRVDADRPFQIYADGDPVADLPAEITVRPGALRVLAPPI
jgi:YegS/Rv2252/BmrU family lipid kinase